MGLTGREERCHHLSPGGWDIRGVYRADNGGFVGTIDRDGVLRGRWCEEPTRAAPEDGGEVEWRLLSTAPGQPPTLDGRFRYGTDEPLRGGWNLYRVGGPELEPLDLKDAFTNPARFCPAT